MIRNFCILAHVDHGKSTLADRFLEITKTVEARKMREQFLDMHPLERERGITIKMQPVRMAHRSYVLNLIDTPGHSDFSYEVSRALAAVEGAILLVDATQGVQAQTVANLESAREQNLTIIPAVNKIDLASARVDETEAEMRELLGGPAEILRVSAKTGEGVEALLDAVIERVPAPQNGDISIYRNVDMSRCALRALVFDSKYDPYQGIIAYIRVVDGEVKKGDRITFLATGAAGEALEVGVFLPGRAARERLSAGEIGYVACGIKEPERVRPGDTITEYIDISTYRNIPPLAGYREPQPVVFASVFPENQDDYSLLADSLKKLKLEDAAFSSEPEDGGALGRGIRIGCLGLLHLEIVSERLEREYGLRLVISHPSVAFRVRKRNDEVEIVYVASRFPPAAEVRSTEEPIARLEFVAPARFLGAIATLVNAAGGALGETATLAGNRLRIRAEAPLRSIIVDFSDRLKSATQGFASFSYNLAGWRGADLVRLDILVAGEPASAFSEIVPGRAAEERGRERIEALKKLLPREAFAVALQAAVDGRIVARETLPALRKDVTGYLYGGDRTRKMKLWKKQERGKKRLRELGRVEIPHDVFVKMFRQ